MELLVRVIYSPSLGIWRVIVGPGVGLLDGGVEHDWPEAWVPLTARRAGGEFYIVGFVNGVPQPAHGDG